MLATNEWLEAPQTWGVWGASSVALFLRFHISSQTKEKKPFVLMIYSELVGMSAPAI